MSTYTIQMEVVEELLWACGSVDKTTDSQMYGPRFESAGNSSSAPRQGTQDKALERTSSRWLLAYKQLAYLVTR